MKPISSLPLHMVIVGGGIAGLATAYVLQKAGHNVSVYEESDGEKRSNGGIRAPPNMVRILRSWGLSESLDRLAVKCSKFSIIKGATGEEFASLHFHDRLVQQLEADFLFIQHGDLWEMLYDLAIRSGAQIHFNSKVVDANHASMECILQNGDRVPADVVIGADGALSLIRKLAMGGFSEESEGSDLTLAYTLPKSTLEEDDDLKWLASEKDWSLWLGDGYLVHGSFIHGGQEFTVVVIIPCQGEWQGYREVWSHRVPLSRFHFDPAKFEPRLWKLLQKADLVTVNVHVDKPEFESIVCNRGRCALVGDAAHPMMPNGQYKAGFAIEDAQTLGQLFSRVTDVSQVTRVLCAYEELRQERHEKSKVWEKKKRQLLSLPDGPEQLKRDELFKKATETTDWGDVGAIPSNQVWTNELEGYIYNTTEAVDDWWTKWGKLLDKRMDSGDELDEPMLPPPTPVLVSTSRCTDG